jgi:hypothetical protein
MERFCLSALPEAELAVITEHLNQCELCHQLFAATLGHQRGTAPIRFTLEPEYWLKHDHLEFEQLVAIANHKLDAIDREMIDIHVAICESCREDVRSFLAFCRKIEPELKVRYGQGTHKAQNQLMRSWSWFRTFAWKPAYAAALVILVIAIVAALILVKRRAANLEAGHPSLQNNNVANSPAQTPKESAVREEPSPTASVPPNELPKQSQSQPLAAKHGETAKHSDNGSAVAVINDGQIIITVDRVGTVSGLSGAPATTRREIADILVAEEIKMPDISNPLSSPPGTLRGTNNGQPFKLISPARAVILTDRPSFAWERLHGASSYRVYVGDGKGHEVAKSEELSPASTVWTFAAPLKRGEIYSWGVAAKVDGKEIFCPGPSGREMKFQILPTQKLHELDALKKTRSHLALGVFYAKTGMLAEAEHQFRILIRLNPNSRVLKKLLKQIQSWN